MLVCQLADRIILRKWNSTVLLVSVTERIWMPENHALQLLLIVGRLRNFNDIYIFGIHNSCL